MTFADAMPLDIEEVTLLLQPTEREVTKSATTKPPTQRKLRDERLESCRV
jgi:hypothetical protein